MKIGSLKKGEMTDYEWFLLLAENGHSSYQYRIAIEINARSIKPDRLIQTYKWLCLSSLLGESRSQEIAQFIYLAMSAEEILLADKLVEDWVEEKFESIQIKDTSGWSQELLQFVKNSADF